MAIENILILGNGDLCRSIISALCSRQTLLSDDCNYKITVLTYLSQTLTLPINLSQFHVSHKTSDFTPTTLQSAFAGYDVILSTMAGGDSVLQISIINAVVAAGVKRFVPDEFSHDSLNKQLQARLPKHAERAKVINHLKNLSDTSPSFEWTAVATGYTLDTKIVNGDMGLDMEWQSATFHGTGMELFAVSSLARVGQVVARVLAQWEQTKNQYIYAAGAIISANDVLKSVEETTGQEFAVGNYGVEECIEEARKRVERGYPDSGLALLERSILYDGQLDASAPFRTHNANDMLGLAPELANFIVIEAYHHLKHLGKPGCACAT
ncbi:hypothetical protein COCMIDRAFT_39780 [Bipolaris oryzae ATCC 44560]|uniref:NmrA-like domain-containing protein n=1 Tax=Bipolaris oryzae ATCC 44560 TaxID=930090 RepID=W6Z387_COCMI|nr:uncharacterized protein COCMIDRAFT_39780 [Bipolaris oryzae ATCC 44560]EUC42124.1 hypothetical protein COCMIDRAFT_39780 [Bipolaris oryzae ATCC 44560]